MAGKILVGIDGSDGGQRALDFARERALLSGEEVVVAYVIEWSPYTFNTPLENERRHQRREEELTQAQHSVLDPALEQLRESGVSVTGVVRHGHAARVIAGLAEEQETCMIIIGRRGLTGIKSILFGSVAGSLVQIANVPVTVVP